MSDNEFIKWLQSDAGKVLCTQVNDAVMSLGEFTYEELYFISHVVLAMFKRHKVLVRCEAWNPMVAEIIIQEFGGTRYQDTEQPFVVDEDDLRGQYGGLLNRLQRFFNSSDQKEQQDLSARERIVNYALEKAITPDLLGWLVDYVGGQIWLGIHNAMYKVKPTAPKTQDEASLELQMLVIYNTIFDNNLYYGACAHTPETSASTPYISSIQHPIVQKIVAKAIAHLVQHFSNRPEQLTPDIQTRVENAAVLYVNHLASMPRHPPTHVASYIMSSHEGRQTFQPLHNSLTHHNISHRHFFVPISELPPDRCAEEDPSDPGVRLPIRYRNYNLLRNEVIYHNVKCSLELFHDIMYNSTIDYSVYSRSLYILVQIVTSNNMLRFWQFLTGIAQPEGEQASPEKMLNILVFILASNLMSDPDLFESLVNKAIPHGGRASSCSRARTAGRRARRGA